MTVRDLSTAGFMAECLRPVLIGSYVSLDLPGVGPVHAGDRLEATGTGLAPLVVSAVVEAR